ncbi:MAG: ABC transporter permease [Acidobacteriota bacterium]
MSARRAASYLLVAPVWVLLGAFFLAPHAVMLATSFRERGLYGGVRPIDDVAGYVASGAFLGNYARTLDPLYAAIFVRSFWMAALTTLLCLAASFPVAYYVAILAGPRSKGPMLAAIVVPFWSSFLIRTYAWVLILRTEGLANRALMALGIVSEPLPLLYSNTAVMIGLVYGELPFMILPLYASLEKLDLGLLEAARDLGATAWQAFWRVTVPVTAPGIAAGVVLVFVPSVGQFVVSDLLGGGKTILLGSLVQNQFVVARNRPFGSAVAFELAAIVLALLLAYAVWAKRRGHEALL